MGLRVNLVASTCVEYAVCAFFGTPSLIKPETWLYDTLQDSFLIHFRTVDVGNQLYLTDYLTIKLKTLVCKNFRISDSMKLVLPQL